MSQFWRNKVSIQVLHIALGIRRSQGNGNVLQDVIAIKGVGTGGHGYHGANITHGVDHQEWIQDKGRIFSDAFDQWKQVRKGGTLSLTDRSNTHSASLQASEIIKVMVYSPMG